MLCLSLSPQQLIFISSYARPSLPLHIITTACRSLSRVPYPPPVPWRRLPDLSRRLGIPLRVSTSSAHPSPPPLTIPAPSLCHLPPSRVSARRRSRRTGPAAAADASGCGTSAAAPGVAGPAPAARAASAAACCRCSAPRRGSAPAAGEEKRS